MRMKGKKVYFNQRDTFSMDYTISRFMVPALKAYRDVIKERHDNNKVVGVPGEVMTQLFPDAGYEYSEEQLSQGMEEWLRRVGEMIFAFDPKSDPDLKDYNFSFQTKVVERYENGSSRISIEHDNEEEYQRFRNDEKLYHERKKVGLQYFSDHYDSLWW